MKTCMEGLWKIGYGGELKRDNGGGIGRGWGRRGLVKEIGGIQRG